MSNILNFIKNNPKETQRLIGLKYEQLEQLISRASALNTQKQQNIEAKKVRIINKGGGRKVKLSIEEQILSSVDIFATLNNISILRYSILSE